jgi:hypothetical protein
MHWPDTLYTAFRLHYNPSVLLKQTDHLAYFHRHQAHRIVSSRALNPPRTAFRQIFALKNSPFASTEQKKTLPSHASKFFFFASHSSTSQFPPRPRPPRTPELKPGLRPQPFDYRLLINNDIFVTAANHSVFCPVSGLVHY